MIISSWIHIAKNYIISFLFMGKQYSILYIYHIFFISSSVNGYLGCFHFFWLLWTGNIGIICLGITSRLPISLADFLDKETRGPLAVLMVSNPERKKSLITTVQYRNWFSDFTMSWAHSWIDPSLWLGSLDDLIGLSRFITGCRVGVCLPQILGPEIRGGLGLQRKTAVLLPE